GEDQGANIMATALFKNQQVKRLISRAINPLHERVLHALGVDEIVHPEEETAERMAKKLCIKNVVDSFELSKEFTIIEAKVPEEYVGKSIREIGFRQKFNILVLTTIAKEEVKSVLGKSETMEHVLGIATPDLILNENEILVLFGANHDLETFLKKRI
ncbi:MAG: TrkA family potassium uptake protein, partial [Algoriphagus sp.]|nr:TrkA family potassium uptake protein [Algoriphagus sp.]